MKARIALNPAMPGNYSFVCPVAPLCLNTINRIGYTSMVSPSILRGLKGGTLIDLDGVIDVETGGIIQVTKQEKTPVKTEVKPVEEIKVESIKEEVTEETPVKTTKSKSAKKSSAKAAEVK